MGGDEILDIFQLFQIRSRQIIFTFLRQLFQSFMNFLESFIIHGLLVFVFLNQHLDSIDSRDLKYIQSLSILSEV